MLGRIIGLAWPIPVLLVFGYAHNAGLIDLGVGEKDLTLVLLLAVFFLVFWLAYAVLWVIKGSSGKFGAWRLMAYALFWASALFIAGWLLLLAYSYLGVDIAGIRF